MILSPAAVVPLFLSTPSSQRATRVQWYSTPRKQISIHALFAEGDRERWEKHRGSTISIHALFAEGDPGTPAGNAPPRQFLSTPSSQRATFLIMMGRGNGKFLSTPSSQRATRPG